MKCIGNTLIDFNVSMYFNLSTTTDFCKQIYLKSIIISGHNILELVFCKKIKTSSGNAKHT